MNVGQIGVTDSFFELGGDSLKAIKLATSAKKEGVIFDLAQLYKYGTIRDLAKEIKFAYYAQEEAENEEEIISEEDFAAILDAIE